MATFICPRCHTLITTPSINYGSCEKDGRGNYYNFLCNEGIIQRKQYLFKCNNTNCNSLIILEGISLESIDVRYPSNPKLFDFSPFSLIVHMSENFVKIYNESFQIEQLGYKDVAGPGYRKAIEFLIKDYIIQTGHAKENEIKQMPIGQCIEKFIEDKRIIELSKRAFWLGNDQTHYYQKWEDKDLRDLKNIIRLLLHYIENDLEYNQIVNEMDE